MNVSDRPSTSEKPDTEKPDMAFELVEPDQSPSPVDMRVDIKKLLPFDWRKLMVLGVSLDDARRIAVNLIIREVVPVYWRKLIELGVPIDEAHDIAEAIARYDTAKKRPNRDQKELIKRYCPNICRAELWRSKLLLV